jgi:hypothetical protein
MSNNSRVIGIVLTQDELESQSHFVRPKPAQLIWLLLMLLELAIALRIGLKLAGASSDAPIVASIYAFTTLFIAPLLGLLNLPITGNTWLEVYSLFAMLVYFVIAWTVEGVFWLRAYSAVEYPH